MSPRIGAALAACAVLALPLAPRAADAAAPAKVNFVFSGDLAGYLEPCG